MPGEEMALTRAAVGSEHRLCSLPDFAPTVGGRPLPTAQLTDVQRPLTSGVEEHLPPREFRVEAHSHGTPSPKTELEGVRWATLVSLRPFCSLSPGKHGQTEISLRLLPASLSPSRPQSMPYTCLCP